MSVERSFLPDGQDGEMIVKPMLRAFHEAYFTSELKAYYFELHAHKEEEIPLSVIAGLKPYDEMVSLLTHNLRDLNRGDGFKRTALHFAVMANDTTLLESLLRLGAWTDAEDMDKQTAGHMAVLTNNLDALNLLLTQPAGFSVHDKRGGTISTLMEEMNVRDWSPEWAEAFEIALVLGQSAWHFTTALDDRDIEKAFQPTIVGYKSGVYTAMKGNHGLSALLKSDVSYQEQMGGDIELAWLHLPANN
ncbi:hypothetical protein N0V86_003565, partial [Didymella sp. IMI 355093]